MQYKGNVIKLKKDRAIVSCMVEKPAGICWGGGNTGGVRERKFDCRNEVQAALHDDVIIEVPEALEGMNALIFFMPIILTMVAFMTARLVLHPRWNLYILAGSILVFFVFKFLSDKLIMARTKNSFFESKVVKILK